MDSAYDLLGKNKTKEIIDFLDTASSGQEISTKIDGAPAIVFWSDFPGLRGPGCSYKLIINQLQKSEPGVYFTNDKEIEDHFTEKTLDANIKEHRINAFKNALKLAKSVKPGFLVWGDTFFSSQKELDIRNSNETACTPNTLTYVFTDDMNKKVRRSDFGIFVHSVVNKNFGISRIKSSNSLLDKNSAFVLDPQDIEPKTKRINIKSELKELQNNLNDFVELNNEKILKQIRKAIKTKDLSCLDDNIAIKLQNVLNQLNEIQNKILENINQARFRTEYEGQSSGGEGFVVTRGNETMKILVDDFKEKNIKHIRSLKECLLLHFN